MCECVWPRRLSPFPSPQTSPPFPSQAKDGWIEIAEMFGGSSRNRKVAPELEQLGKIAGYTPDDVEQVGPDHTETFHRFWQKSMYKQGCFSARVSAFRGKLEGVSGIAKYLSLSAFAFTGRGRLLKPCGGSATRKVRRNRNRAAVRSCHLLGFKQPSCRDLRVVTPRGFKQLRTQLLLLDQVEPWF